MHRLLSKHTRLRLSENALKTEAEEQIKYLKSDLDWDKELILDSEKGKVRLEKKAWEVCSVSRPRRGGSGLL